ncbi:hypothetical protein A2617_04560 [Candidatus Daviesbacteria bacterium RIFOXYD1_FULL_41_10]|uniref:PsbP C-terminal domain-containing protein n=2 Tax=Candidatus Daviesiibacteriota TaxID=1752718 RepID=A0A1F5N147_9BACT|nr:MAG: hypothetical protein UU67_C0005G0007 [Candidatus Daviesbacteria bacterium GW2011_GWB1_41_5]OGE71303.1 MAG: hypothetical protein A2617_04560 [Candidatus Daviesbacteria bacterium RIFOXYD1_FULL_41_10]
MHKQKGPALSTSTTLSINSSKGFAPIIFLILITLVVSGYLLYTNFQKPASVSTSQQVTQTSTASPAPTSVGETANWKTYVNNRVGYSVRYPESWYIYERVDGQKNQYMTDIQDIKDPEKIEDMIVGTYGPPGSTIFSISNNPSDNPKGLEVIDWAKKSTAYGYRYTDITDVSLVIVDSISATIFATTNGNNVHYYVVLLPKGHKIYEISLFGGKELLLKILSTFKFTN